jgi:hypothetical protein
VGDNTETNLAIARRSGKPIVGCHSHRLNLGVKLFLRSYSAELQLVEHLNGGIIYQGKFWSFEKWRL